MSKSDLPYIKSIFESNKESNLGITLLTDISLNDYFTQFIDAKYNKLQQIVSKVLKRKITHTQLNYSIYYGILGDLINTEIARRIGDILYLLLFGNTYKIIGTKLTDELTIDDVVYSVGTDLERVYVNTEFRLGYRHSYTLDTITKFVETKLEKHKAEIKTETVLYYQDFLLYLIRMRLRDIVGDAVFDAVRDITRRIDNTFESILDGIYHLCIYAEDELLKELNY